MTSELLPTTQPATPSPPPTAYQRHTRIVALRNQAEETFLHLGEELYHFVLERCYQELDHPTFESYLADPDVDLGRTLAYRLKRVHAVFVYGLEQSPVKLLEAGASKLVLIAPHVNEENVEGWVATAAALSRSDLRKELQEAFGTDAVPKLPIDYRLWARAWKRAAKKHRMKAKGEAEWIRAARKQRKQLKGEAEWRPERSHD